MTKKNDRFLRELEQSRQKHLKGEPGHVDGPSEKSVEELEADIKRLEWEAAKEQAEYWREKRQASTGGGGAPVSASNQSKNFPLPKRTRRQWK